jgi:hypothetical protein
MDGLHMGSLEAVFSSSVALFLKLCIRLMPVVVGCGMLLHALSLLSSAWSFASACQSYGSMPSTWSSWSRDSKGQNLHSDVSYRCICPEDYVTNVNAKSPMQKWPLYNLIWHYLVVNSWKQPAQELSRSCHGLWTSLGPGCQSAWSDVVFAQRGSDDSDGNHLSRWNMIRRHIWMLLGTAFCWAGGMADATEVQYL